MYRLETRFYDPEIGRFINADSLSMPINFRSNYVCQNLYAYCDGNPVMYADDNGNAAILVLVAVGAIAAGLSAASEIAYQVSEYDEVKRWGDVGVAAVGGASSVCGPYGMAFSFCCTTVTSYNKAVDEEGNLDVMEYAQIFGEDVGVSIGGGASLKLIKALDEPVREYISSHFSFFYNTIRNVTSSSQNKSNSNIPKSNTISNNSQIPTYYSPGKPYGCVATKGMSSNMYYFKV